MRGPAPKPTRVLVLAGTAEANVLVRVLAAESSIAVTASLAGRTRSPRSLPCPVRTGGFGAVDGLADHLRRERIDVLVDATHPYAAQMPHHAAAAARAVGIDHIRVLRPPWPRPSAAEWHEVADIDAAVAALRTIDARRVLLSIGRQMLSAFPDLHGVPVVLRTVDPPHDVDLDVLATIPLRPPLTLQDELDLLRRYHIDAVVTRNAGGVATYAKVAAAVAAPVPMVVLQRPPPPPDCMIVPDVSQVLRLLGVTSGPRPDQPDDPQPAPLES